MEYASLLKEGLGAVPTIPTEDSLQRAVSVKEDVGWALKENKKSNRFNDTQKQYLKDKFNLGQLTGKKAEAEAVARDMRRAKGTDGKRQFGTSEILTAQQISSFFSRLAAKARKGIVTDDDLRAAEEEQDFNSARENILSLLQVQHPIVYNQYDICSMVKKGTLKNFKLEMLKLICESFELDVSSTKPIRKKAPYISLLTEMVEGCSCTKAGDSV